MDDALMIIGEVFGVDKQTSFNIFIGLATAFIGIFVILLFFLRRTPAQKTVVIAGPSDSGKTVLFSRLITDGRADPMTVTSQKENIFDDYSTKLDRKTIRLVDVPGADKVRSSILAAILKKHPISGLIYTVDSSAVVKECREVAEYLYELLADTPTICDRRNFPVLIVCNKQDSPTAKSSKVVKSTLEKEFALLNQTRAAALDNVGAGSGSGKRILSQSGKEFSFDKMPQKIEFTECTAKKSMDKANVDGVEKWLNNF